MHIDVKLQMYSVKIAVLSVRTIPQNPPHSGSLLMCITVGIVSKKKKNFLSNNKMWCIYFKTIKMTSSFE